MGRRTAPVGTGGGLVTGYPDGPDLDGGPTGLLDVHLANLAAALLPYRETAGRLARWGEDLAGRLTGGARLLVAGNGGSAAEAQHLAAELVGKLHQDRPPLSAIALCAETSALTAIGNDYGFDEVFARQVRAHGRAGDVLLLLSTSGRSANLVRAARAGRELGLPCWAFTGPTPNPLADVCTDVLAVSSPDNQVVQELQLLSAHLLCQYVEAALPGEPPGPVLAGSVPGSGAHPPGMSAVRPSGLADPPLVIRGAGRPAGADADSGAGAAG